MSDAEPVNLLACAPDQHGHCVTCMDEALRARVLLVDPAQEVATVIVGGTTIEVDVSLVDDLAPDDTIMVHGGVAIEKL